MLRMIETASAALLVLALALTPAAAVDNKTTTKQPAAKAAQAAKKAVKGGVKTTVGTVGTGATVAELSAYECRTLGGTVVVVADDRCGASRKYCRMPDTLAACIDELTD